MPVVGQERLQKVPSVYKGNKSILKISSLIILEEWKLKALFQGESFFFFLLSRNLLFPYILQTKNQGGSRNTRNMTCKKLKM